MSDAVSSRERAVILEEETALLLDGKRTPASGAKVSKGDVTSPRWLAECKYRGSAWNSDQITVELEWLETIYTHATRVNRMPLLVVETEDADRAVLLLLSDYLRVVGLEMEEVRFRGECPLRSFTLGAEEWEVLPFFLRLNRIEIPENEWAVISWGEMRELRRQHQPTVTANQRGLPAAPRTRGFPRSLLSGGGWGRK